MPDNLIVVYFTLFPVVNVEGPLKAKPETAEVLY